MAKNNDRDVFLSSVQPRSQKALLFELKGKRDGDDWSTVPVSTEMFAALTIEEVIAHVRTRQPCLEIVELKILGSVRVLSSSEHL